MAIWRVLASAAIILSAVSTGRAQTYSLAETLQLGDCFHFRLVMTIKGEIHVTKNGKPDTLPLAATARHGFSERVLALDAKGLPQKAARSYESANAVIAVGKDRSERTLRPERRLQVAYRSQDQSLIYCPTGPLTREELALTSEHFDTLALSGLLPGKAVAVGDTWKIAEAVTQELCGFEGITAQDLTCKLEEVKDKVARVSVKGTATGIDLGALTKLTIDAAYRFDLGQHRLVSLEWKQKDQRDQGPASPDTTVESTTTLLREAISEPSTLSDVALVSVPDGLEPQASLTQLYYVDPKNRFDLAYAREWQTVGLTDDHLVLRMLDRGDFVAQVTITPWSRSRPGEHLSADAFREAMAKVPGWEQGDVLQEGEVPSEPGRWIYRISAMGQLDGIKVLQNFYLVAGPNGDQVVLAFTLTPSQAEKLGARDLSMAGSIDFPGNRKDGGRIK
jgi:hypothetical protein